jgi:hypothetical protein
MVTTPTHGQSNWDVPLNAALNDLQDQININPASDADWRPVDQGYVTWSMDPAFASNVSALTAGVMTLIKVPIRAKTGTTVLVSNIELGINSGGVTLTAGQNFAALYNSAGTRLALTADQSAVWTSAGHKTMALTVAQNLTSGYYWIAVLANGATTPQILRATNATAASANSKTTAATTRFGSFGAGLTATPASFTPASITPVLMGWFAGLS